MRHIKTKESGFTLIEAMVAFLIIVVGLAGAALFQSELIAESGASKARAAAVKLAEKELEVQRSLLTQDDYDDLITFIAAGAPRVSTATVGNAVYDISFSAVSAATSTAIGVSEDYYQLSVAVNWDDAKGNSDTVILSTVLSQNLPDKSLDDSEQAGSGSNVNVDQIEKPSGNAEAVANVIYEDRGRTSAEIGDFVDISVDGGPVTYGVKTENTTCDDGSQCETVVSAINLKSNDYQVFKISGKIFFHEDSDLEAAFLNPIPDPTHREYPNDIPRVLASEGGGCVMYTVSSQVNYTCLFGEGWYGTISLLLPYGTGGTPDETACLSPRTYKYYRIDKSLNGGAVGEPAIIGQGGVLRFTGPGGNGPYLASSNAAPGFSYYYLSSFLDRSVTNDVTDILNESGNVTDQNFLVVDDVANDWEDVDTNCINGGGRRDSEPLVEVVGSYEDYPTLTNKDYEYTDASNITVTLPDDEIILGYVDATYEIRGSINVSGVTGNASDLISEFEVGISPLPDFAQLCNIAVVDDNSLEYTCFVDYRWNGSVSIDTLTGSLLSVNFVPLEYDFTDLHVTADVESKNFTVTEIAP